MEPATARTLGLGLLAALVIGSTISSGIFGLPQNTAAGAGAILTSWVITGVGMLMLALVYQMLALRKPDLDNGVYAYARAPSGEYVGLNSAWGYWISVWIGNVDYLVAAFGAGSTVAGNATGLGKRVALIERDKLGGTCLNYGCDPTKTLSHTASVLYHAQHATGLGLQITQAKGDWDVVQAHMRQVQDTIRDDTFEQARAGIAAQGIDLFMGQAMFTSPHEILVNGEILRSKRFLIATGTVALIPDIEGLAETGYITNVEAVSLLELPKRLVLIDAGPIGLEFAQMFSRLGSQVVVLEHGKQPLPREDPELTLLLCSQLTAEGIRQQFGAEMRCGEINDHDERRYVNLLQGLMYKN